MWLTIISLTLLGTLLILAIVVVYGAARWRTATLERRDRLEAGREQQSPAPYNSADMDGLPAPVARYFQAVLREGQPIIASAWLTHKGRFNMSESEAKWKRFVSSQLVVTHRPGFDWDARIALAPRINVFVHDTYTAGQGSLRAALLGAVTVAAMRDTPEMAEGELMRFLAEAVWYPTALLPSQGIRWEAIDESSARATMTDGGTSVALEFSFDAEGLVSTVRSPARYRNVNGVPTPMPWQGRFWRYEERNGMRVPIEAEVAWQLPQGELPYWRGEITGIAHEFVGAPHCEQ